MSIWVLGDQPTLVKERCKMFDCDRFIDFTHDNLPMTQKITQDSYACSNMRVSFVLSIDASCKSSGGGEW